jgi:polysaccharide deacetylase 2 family uncharacterized protein YibQ
MPRRRSRGSRFGGFVLFLLGLLVGAGVLLLFRQPPASPAAPEAAPRREAPARPVASRPARRAPADHLSSEHSPVDRLPSEHAEPEGTPVVASDPPPAAPAPGPVHGVRIALVIDDLGHDVADLGPLEALKVPVTYSVLPFEEQTPQVVAELRRRGAEILLHLPMEPMHGQNPGPGALLQGMSDGELKQRTEAALKAVPGVAGVNNHMGSLLSSEEGPMRSVLEVLAERGLFFLDSRTSAQSVGYKVAVGMGIPAAERQVFLDGETTPEAIHEQFQRLLVLARAKGAAIAIGHPHPETLAALAREVPKARAAGFEFVPVSYLLTRSGGE